MKARKILAMVMALALTAALAVGGTLAYLTNSTKAITNTFTVGNVKASLTETGASQVGDGLANSYKMVPGNTIAKNPTAGIVANSEACWLFVKIEEKGKVEYTPAGATTAKTAGFNEFLTYAVANSWTKLGSETKTDSNGNNTFIYYCAVDATTAAAGATYPILVGGATENMDGQVQVNDNVTQEMMNGLEIISEGEAAPQLIFTACAVQSANLTTVEAAYEQAPEAFKA